MKQENELPAEEAFSLPEKGTPTDVFMRFIIAYANDDNTGGATLSPYSADKIITAICTEKKTFREAVNRFYGRKIVNHILPDEAELEFEQLVVTGDTTICRGVAFLEVKRFREDKFDSFVFTSDKGEWKLALELDKHEETANKMSFTQKVLNTVSKFVMAISGFYD